MSQNPSIRSAPSCPSAAEKQRGSGPAGQNRQKSAQRGRGNQTAPQARSSAHGRDGLQAEPAGVEWPFDWLEPEPVVGLEDAMREWEYTHTVWMATATQFMAQLLKTANWTQTEHSIRLRATFAEVRQELHEQTEKMASALVRYNEQFGNETFTVVLPHEFADRVSSKTRYPDVAGIVRVDYETLTGTVAEGLAPPGGKKREVRSARDSRSGRYPPAGEHSRGDPSEDGDADRLPSPLLATAQPSVPVAQPSSPAVPSARSSSPTVPSAQSSAPTPAPTPAPSHVFFSSASAQASFLRSAPPSSTPPPSLSSGSLDFARSLPAVPPRTGITRGAAVSYTTAGGGFLPIRTSDGYRGALTAAPWG